MTTGEAIFLNGFPGVGKLPISKALAAKLPAGDTILLDNYLLIDPINAIIPGRGTSHKDLRRPLPTTGLWTAQGRSQPQSNHCLDRLHSRQRGVCVGVCRACWDYSREMFRSSQSTSPAILMTTRSGFEIPIGIRARNQNCRIYAFCNSSCQTIDFWIQLHAVRSGCRTPGLKSTMLAWTTCLSAEESALRILDFARGSSKWY